MTPVARKWPRDVFSLGHVALPFSPDDPLYGRGDGVERRRIQIGALALRGERGVLSVPGGEMLRIRWNPFHAWQERRILEFVGLGPR